MANQVIVLPDVRLAFADIWKARPPKNGKGDAKYGANGIFAKESKAYSIAEAAFLKAAQEEYGANWQNFLSVMEPSKKCLRNGDRNINSQTGEIRQGFAGNFYITAKNKNRPLVVAHRFHNGKPVYVQEDGTAITEGRPVTASDLGWEIKKPYGGCYVNLKVEIGAMKAKGEISACVFARLVAVQFLRDGEAFGSGPATADGFEDTGEDEGEGAPTGAGVNAGGFFG